MFFSNYVNFSGRSRRSEFWKVFLINFLIGLVAGIIIVIIGANTAVSYYSGSVTSLYGGSIGVMIVGIIVGLWNLVCFLPNLSILVRRLHDLSMSGWWALLMLAMIIPIINFLVAIAAIVLFCIDGKPETNEWGPSPKYVIA